MFMSNVSAINFSASGSIQVVTNVAKSSRELPSSINSSWMKQYAAGSMPSSGSLSAGTGVVNNRPVRAGEIDGDARKLVRHKT